MSISYHKIMNYKTDYKYKDFTRAQETKKARLLSRIKKMLKANDNVYFLTFTFTNKTLEKTKAETRKRIIKRFLNEQANEYILNIDFGKEREREHYHAIASAKDKIFLFQKYKHGYMTAKRIYKGDYLNAHNLMLHAIKETTRNNALIFSRGLKKIKSAEEEKERFNYEDFINEELEEIYNTNIFNDNEELYN